jgi:hypothetical protein
MGIKSPFREAKNPTLASKERFAMSKSIFVPHKSTQTAPRVIPEGCPLALARAVALMNALSLQSNAAQVKFTAAGAAVGAIQAQAVWVLVAVTVISTLMSAGAGALGIHLQAEGLESVLSFLAPSACGAALSALLWHRAEERAKALGAPELGEQWRNYCAAREVLRKAIFLYRAGVLDGGELSKVLRQVCQQVWPTSPPKDDALFAGWTSEQDPYLFDEGDDGFSELELDHYVQLRARGQSGWMDGRVKGKLAKLREAHLARLRQIQIWQASVRWMPFIGEALSGLIGRLSAIESQRYDWLAVEKTIAGYTEVIAQMAAPLEAYDEFLSRCMTALCEILAVGDAGQSAKIRSDLEQFIGQGQPTRSLAAEFVEQCFPSSENALAAWKGAERNFLPELAKVVENILGAEHADWLRSRVAATNALEQALSSIFVRGVASDAPSGEGAQVPA